MSGNREIQDLGPGSQETKTGGMKLRRYNSSKRGSFEISMWFYDWELSTVIGALRAFRKDHEAKAETLNLASFPGYVTFLARLENKFSKALGKLLKVEFRDIKLGETRPLLEEEGHHHGGC